MEKTEKMIVDRKTEKSFCGEKKMRGERGKTEKGVWVEKKKVCG